MLIKDSSGIKSSEITDKKLYLSRRTFMRAGILAATTVATGALYRQLAVKPRPVPRSGVKLTNIQQPAGTNAAWHIDEPPTSFQDITNYNNYYEFSTDKRDVADEAQSFVTRPWTIAVEGLVHKPKVYDLDELFKLSPLEDRIYRHRCVEGWSMVIPWVGFPLHKLLAQVEPTAQAKYVAFETVYDPKQMPGQRTSVLPWPYTEGLRLDEALHPLTILATGIYGETLPPQNGAPLRLVVPWKYGFKGIKSIVKIRLVDEQPVATWNAANPREYGFYSNVNPQVNHPRWSQARERRIGEYGMRPTLLFNGYAEQVASLYSGMDLRKYF